MKNLILFDDDDQWRNLLPLTYTKPISELRVGLLTIREKWELLLDATASYITQDYLSEKFGITIEDDNVIVNSSILPNRTLVDQIEALEPNQALLWKEELVAARLDRLQFDRLIKDNEADEIEGIFVEDEDLQVIQRPADLFLNNGREIEQDFDLVTHGRTSQTPGASNTIIGEGKIFIEEGARVECAVLNTTTGPIYIGHSAEIMEGCMVRGPFAMAEHSVLKMGAKVYPGTTLGPHSKAGGELNNVVIQAFSNKAHDGFLGNSVIGEWCNIGADTNCSNLKNNYEEVKVWSYVTQRFEKTGLTFHGVIMGDHSKCGINTMLNTGTVIGVSANIYGDGFPRNFIPSYSWGGSSGYQTYLADKALATAEAMMARREVVLTEEDVKILKYIFFESAKYRNWE